MTEDQERRAAEEAFAKVRDELAGTPVADIVANHVLGIWQLAIIHLSLDSPGRTPNLDEARLAIDAMAGILEATEGRLGEHEEALGEAIAQTRLAYAKLSERGNGRS